MLVEDGWPAQDLALPEILQIMTNKGILSRIKLPGSHHIHLDPTYAPATAKVIVEFLESD